MYSLNDSFLNISHILPNQQSWQLISDRLTTGMKDLQLSTLHILVFFFSKTRKSMNMPISASKKEHLFSRIKGCFFIINVSQTKTLVFSSIIDEIRWFKNNRQADLFAIYSTIYYIYAHIYGSHGDNKLHILQNISATAFLLLPSYHIYSYITCSYITYHMSHFTFFKVFIT